MAVCRNPAHRPAGPNWRLLAIVAAGLVLGIWAGNAFGYSRRTPVVEVVEKTRPGIVTIKVEKAPSSERRGESTGTGIIVDERGYVVTNYHVISGANRITVYLHTGAKLPAQVVAEDPSSDVAVLRLLADEPLHALPLGPGSDLLVGETVIAVGHPFGYTNTVSTGIISGLDRQITLPSGEVLHGVIQITASINPGNSGGPLLNVNGELIGMNVAMRNGAQGIAFALNVDTVKEVLGKHLSAVKVAGVTHGLTCTERVAPEGDQRQRVVVTDVCGETPAALAGLRPGDAILRVADRAVQNPFDLERSLWDAQPGQRIPLRVLRDGQELTLNLPVRVDNTARGGSGPANRVAAPARMATVTETAGRR